jgi:hypothetical protein
MRLIIMLVAHSALFVAEIVVGAFGYRREQICLHLPSHPIRFLHSSARTFLYFFIYFLRYSLFWFFFFGLIFSFRKILLWVFFWN